MRIRPAVVDDAQEMGRVMVESFLSAHRGQIPEDAFRTRVEEWTPEVSARGWARGLDAIADGSADREVVLLAEDDTGLLALVSGHPAEGDASGTIAEIAALYVLPGRRGEGIGGSLLRAAATALVELGFTAIHVGVLTANRPARGFYEAMGGQEIGQTTIDEEGHLVPLTIYAWPDGSALVHPLQDGSPTA